MSHRPRLDNTDPTDNADLPRPPHPAQLSQQPTSQIRVMLFSVMPYEKTAIDAQLAAMPKSLSAKMDLVLLSASLDHSTVSLVSEVPAISVSTDDVNSYILHQLSRRGVRLIAVRYANSSTIDVVEAAKLGIIVSAVPAHSPTSIAEFTIALMLNLNRKVHIAHNRVRDGNLTLNGLVGFDLAEKTVGIIGTARVGQIVSRILSGFGCRILAYDMMKSDVCVSVGVKYVCLAYVLEESDILTIHAPLVPGTRHIFNHGTLARCKRGVHIINTSRGGLMDINAVIDSLHSGQVGGLAMDVYEGERSWLFQDSSHTVDWPFEVLKAMPNVLVTGHQSSLTSTAVAAVAHCTIKTILQFLQGKELEYSVERLSARRERTIPN